jgi:phenylalanyl-tRNA synthetase alpha chain
MAENVSPSVEELRARFAAAIGGARSERDLQVIRDEFLGRKNGALTALMKRVAAATPAERPVLGRLANDLKQDIETRLAERRTAFDATRRPAHAVDITLPGRLPRLGHRHPLSVIAERIEEIFWRMGFEVLGGAEVEDDYHNFEALNMPPDHPARDMQDTFYLEQPLDAGDGTPRTLLRTHTSAMQIRYMETHAPPVRIVAIGRVYRRDNPDLTHTPAFTQLEGLVVGERISLADLKGTIQAFMRELFSPKTAVHFRPSFFPYTEPSAEIFIGCIFCAGAGCPVCKRTGWLEVAGSGMVHPALFEFVGYDPERYTGFAFGLGVERVAQLLYGVEDMRQFYENDMRMLEQFPY